MFVISRTTAFTYREKLVDTKQIGRELGVRYIPEEERRGSGNQLRVNAQLIDAETDAHLWPSSSTATWAICSPCRARSRVHIANALGVELIAVEAARPSEHPDALDYILRGRVASVKPLSRRKLYRDDWTIRARIGAQSAICRGAELFGDCARGPQDGMR